RGPALLRPRRPPPPAAVFAGRGDHALRRRQHAAAHELRHRGAGGRLRPVPAQVRLPAGGAVRVQAGRHAGRAGAAGGARPAIPEPAAARPLAARAAGAAGVEGGAALPGPRPAAVLEGVSPRRGGDTEGTPMAGERDALRDWHRLFGLLLIDFFTG